MAASINDKITRTQNATNPVVAKVNSPRTVGVTTLSCDSLSGWPTATGVHFATYKVDSNLKKVAGSQVDWKGIVSGTNITSLTVKNGTDNGNAVGDYVEMMPTAAWGDELFTGLTKEHSQLDGSHTGINSTSITNVGALTQTGATSLNGSWDGWIGANESWTYLSSTTVTVPSDATTKYAVGDWVKLTQSATVKHFVITGVTATVLTLSPVLPTGTSVANATISANAYSKARNPGVTLGGIIPYNPYKFSAYRSAMGAMSDSTWITVDVLTENFDTGNNFNNTTGVFTAPISGFYQFNATAGTSNGAGNLQGAGLQLYRTSGTPTGLLGGDVDFDNNVSYDLLRASISGVVQLTAGDTVVLRGQIKILGGAIALANIYFSGFLISAL